MTPNFDDNVSWVVFRDPLRLPRYEINWLIMHLGKPARFPEPRKLRFVLANFKESRRCH